MSLVGRVALCCTLGLAVPALADRDVAGVWKSGDTVLNLERAGTGTLSATDSEDQALTWKLEKTGALILTFADDTAKCLLTLKRDSMLCRGTQPSTRWPMLKKEGWVATPEVPVALAPCTIRVVEGASAGPIRLGMKEAELAKLRLGLEREVPTREWMVGGPYRVRLDARGVAVLVRVEAKQPGEVCLEKSAKPMAACPFELRTGGTFSDCPARGVRSVHSDRTHSLEWVEVFAPGVPRVAAPDECTIPVVPGVSVGPLRLGMSRDQATRAGLGLQAGYGSSLFAGPYLAFFDSAGKISAIRLSVENLGTDQRACLDSQPIAGSWRVDELCTRGFCSCTVARGWPATGTSNASCAEGVRFQFDVTAPGRLFLLEVQPRAAGFDAGSAPAKP